ncbi:hypothetical protein O9992_00250 [Vibrio lentus]|nr:hypothetical protein [Vibrio lentus]
MLTGFFDAILTQLLDEIWKAHLACMTCSIKSSMSHIKDGEGRTVDSKTLTIIIMTSGTQPIAICDVCTSNHRPYRQR